MAPSEDDIRPEMLKTMNNFGACWLIRVLQIAWKTGEVPKHGRPLLQYLFTKKEITRNALTTGAFLCEIFLEKSIRKVPQKEMRRNSQTSTSGCTMHNLPGRSTNRPDLCSSASF